MKFMIFTDTETSKETESFNTLDELKDSLLDAIEIGLFDVNVTVIVHAREVVKDEQSAFDAYCDEFRVDTDDDDLDSNNDPENVINMDDWLILNR